MEEDDQKHKMRMENMQDVFKKQREAIRQMRKDKETLERHEIEAVLEKYPPTGSKKREKKPLWAMTEREKEAFDEAEAADLISFAEGLDFDKFVGDHEFRNALQCVHDRARKLQKEQDAFKDSILREFNDNGSGCGADEAEVGSRLEDGVDGTSMFGDIEPNATGMARRSQRLDSCSNADRPDWDASTAAGEDGPGANLAAKAAAERALENNPHLRAVHSKGSVQKLIEKARSEGVPATPSLQGH
jgi:hypothetical protein